MALRNQLAKKQRELKLTNQQMADKLGVNESTYRKVKAGTRNPGYLVLTGIVNQFPELAPHIWAFLASRNRTIGPRTGRSGATVSATPASPSSAAPAGRKGQATSSVRSRKGKRANGELPGTSETAA